MPLSLLRNLLRSFFACLWCKHPFGAFRFVRTLYTLLGFYPRRILLYKAALHHLGGSEQIRISNERLEFLGDGVLDSIIATYLYNKYPFRNEGFLTEMKSKIVNRKVLNSIGAKLSLLEYLHPSEAPKHKDSLGNALEALIGAIYLDRGFEKTALWVRTNIILPHLFLDQIEVAEANIKNKLMQWASKTKSVLTLKLLKQEKLSEHKHLFEVGVFVNDVLISKGTGVRKKEAEQVACLGAFDAISRQAKYIPEI